MRHKEIETHICSARNDYWLLKRLAHLVKLLLSKKQRKTFVKDTFSEERLFMGMFYEGEVWKGTLNENGNFKLTVETTDKLFKLMASQTLSPLVKINIISILVEEKDKYHKLYTMCHKLAEMEKKLSMSIALYDLQERIKFSIMESEDRSENNPKMMAYFNSINIYNDLKLKISSYNNLQEKLFSLLEIYDPDLQIISELVQKLTVLQVDIQKYWKDTTDDVIDSVPEILKLFALFIKAIDSEQYCNLTSLYRTIRTKSSMRAEEIITDGQVFIGIRTVNLLVSLQPESFGRILMCSENIVKELNRASESLIGKNLKSLIPESFYRKYFKSLETRFDFNRKPDKYDELKFAISADGSYKAYRSVDSILTHQTFGLCHWMIWNFDKSQDEYLVIDDQGAIEGYTKEIAADFGENYAKNASMKSLTNILGDFAESYNEKMISTNFKYFSIPNDTSKMYKFELQTADSAQNITVFKAQKKHISSIGPEMRYSDIDMVAPEILEAEEPPRSKLIQNSKAINTLKNQLERDDTRRTTKKMIINKEKLDHSYQSSSLEVVEKENLIRGLDAENSVGLSSLNSSSQNLNQKKEMELNNALNSLRFSQFKEKYVPIISTFIFVSVYLSTILLNYKESDVIIKSVEDKLGIFNLVSARSRYTLEVSRNAYANLLYQNYYPNGHSKQVFNQGQMLGRIANLSQANSELLTAIGQVNDDDLTNRFFEKRVKVYYGDYTSIETTDKYTVENSFVASNMLLTKADILYKLTFIEDEYQHQVMEYMMTNAFNDLALENEDLFNVIIDNLHNQLDRRLRFDIYFLVTTICLLILCLISTQIVLYKAFRNNVDFLTRFIDPNSSTLALNSERESTLGRSPKKQTGRSNIIVKFPKTKTLVASLILKSVVIFFTICSPLVLLLINHEIVVSNDGEIRKTLRDCYNLNKIRIHGYYTINLEITSVCYPQGYSLNKPTPTAFIDEINNLNKIISIDLGFSNEALHYLNMDVCPYYLYHPTRPVCQNLAGNIGKKGVISVIISGNTYFLSLEKQIRDANGTASLLYQLMLPQAYLDNYYIISNGVNPAIGNFQERLMATLKAYLNDVANGVMSIFFGGLAMGMFIISIQIYIMWVSIGRERRICTQLIRLVPPEYLVRNRDLKEFLCLQSNEARHYLKKIERKRKF